jgi:hypothetical protein
VEAGLPGNLALEILGNAMWRDRAMPWVLSKSPVHYHGTTLTDDDIGTIKIALATAATTTMDFWGKTHPFEGQKNIYDVTLDRVLAMEEEGTTYESLLWVDQPVDVVIGGIGPTRRHSQPRVSWLGAFLNRVFLWG